MARLKVPSVPHLARLWKPDEVAIKDALIRLTKSAPPFSYAQLLGMVRSMLALKSDLREMELLIQRGVRGELAQKCYLEIAPLLSDHFAKIAPSFVHEVSVRVYPLNRHLRVPFEPPMVFGFNGKTYLPLFIFWRTNPLTPDQLSLMASMVRELIAQDPDLDLATTSILDFSAPKGVPERVFRQLALNDIPSISSAKRDEMLSVFAAGFELARKELAGQSEGRNAGQDAPSKSDDDQPDLFG